MIARKKNIKTLKFFGAPVLAFLILLLMFSFSFAQVTNEGGGKVDTGTIIPCDGPDCTICSVFELISNLVNFFTFKLAAPLGVGVIMYAGFMMITSGGNEKNKDKGVEALQAAIWGLVITFASWLIVNTVLGALADKSFYESWNKFPGC